MRIAVNGWFWNRPETGSGQYTRQLISELPRVAPGCQISVFVPRFASEQPELPQADSPNISLTHLACGNNALHKVLWEQVTIPRAAKHVNADLLHVPYWAPPLRSPIPTVVTVHDIIPAILPAYRGSPQVRLYTAFVSATSRFANAVLTDSIASKRDIIQHLRLDEHSVHAVHLAADNHYTDIAGSEDIAIRAHYGLEDNYILYLGGFDYRKNLSVLFQAFPYIAKSAPQAKLVIAGKLPAPHTANTLDPRVLAQQANLDANNIIYPGFIDEAHKAAILRGARVFVFPSLYEGFGLPPLEAMQCGVPVVGCDCTSIPEVIGAGGILVAPDDVQGLAGAIIHLMSDDTFHATMRQQALLQATHFSWQKTAAKTFEIFNSIID